MCENISYFPTWKKTDTEEKDPTRVIKINNMIPLKGKGEPGTEKLPGRIRVSNDVLRSRVEELWRIAVGAGDESSQILMEEALVDLLGPIRGEKAIESLKLTKEIYKNNP